MVNLQPTTRPRHGAVWFQGSTTAVAVALFLSIAVSATAGPHRARLSTDLAKHFSATAAPVDVIVSGTPDTIDRLARRHGLTIKKSLETGAVFTVSRSKFDALSQDAEIDALSGDPEVHSHMAVTTKTTGAEAAWAGQVAALGGAVNGQGIGVAIIDSGVMGDHPALNGKVVATVDFTDSKGVGKDQYGHGTHLAGIIAGKGYRNGPEGAASGMAPGAHLINLKVLKADGSGQASDVIQAIDWAIKWRNAPRCGRSHPRSNSSA